MPIAVAVAVWVTYSPNRLLNIVLALPFFVLSMMFLFDYDSIHLVAWYGGEELPLRYRFAATWAAREGPILLWVAWLALLSTIWHKPFEKESESARAMRLRLMNGFALTLLLVAWILDPFKAAGNDGPGLNELLQTDLMVIHPPLIFLAYSLSLTLAFTGIAGLFTDPTGMKERLITIARTAFFFATLGIGLGGLWAYLILDWGGYWAWDPVETGSLLPWIALVVLLHLRTRPGRSSDHLWAGVAMSAGALSLFATMVTRAGGVWAVSVHTFVVESGGSAPTDVMGRLMLLTGDASGVEVMIYLLGFIQLMAILLAHRFGGKFSHWWLALLPIIASLGVIGGGDVLGKFSDWWLALLPEYGGGEVLDSVPESVLIILAFGPMIESALRAGKRDDWAWFSIPLVMVGLRFLHDDVLVELVSITFALGMILEKERLAAWGWASAGVMLFLAGSWAGMIEVWVSAVGMVAFVAPWFILGEDGEISLSFKERSTQQRLALWTPVMAVGLYLILTFVILIASIDSIQFAAHELYGAPFLAAILVALSMWGLRTKPQRVFALLCGIPTIFVFSYFFGDSLGYDSTDVLGATLTRGQIGMVVLIPGLIALPAVFSLVYENRERKGIPFFAHIIHLGLVLMLVGHVMSTTIIDRGTFSHSVTLIKDEKIEWEGYEFEFVEVKTQTEGLEVGDGYLGAVINVYEDGELIETVEPGVLRFDNTGTSRSEVDRISMLHGDLVLIMDGTQARSLMEGSDLVRIMVYDLPGIHLVWGGWVLMMLGMLRIKIEESRPTD